MCYALLLSTTSSDDLSQFNSEGLRFEKTIPDRLSSSDLYYPNKWYVGSRTGCSCSFRHLAGPEFEFGVPEDWFPEDKLDIEATLLFIRVVRSLVLKAEQIDCVDLWAGSDAGDVEIPLMPVNLNQIPDEQFRFFENHHFDFVTI
jgi:hypothetical protein